MLTSCLYQACLFGVNRSLDQKTTAKPQQQPQPPSRASLLSSCAPTNPRTENEADDEVNASTVRSDGFNIYAAGFGCDSRAPCWTAARLLSDSASPGTILYTGLFDAIGGGPDCARAVAAMSADYAAVAHLHTPSRQRRHSCSFARQGVSPSMSIWRNRTLSDSQASWEEALRDDNAQHQQLATHLGGAGLLADRLPADLLDCHSDAIDRLLSDRIPVSTVEDRLGWALHRLDADLCGLTLPSPSDPCCVPMHGEWARRLAQTGAVGTAVSMETSVRSGGRCLRIAQIGDGAAVIGSVSATGATWDWRRPVAPHTIENWREVRRLAQRFPEPAARAGLFARNCFLGEQEATRAFGRVGLKWSVDRLTDVAWASPTMPTLPASLTGLPEVAAVQLAPADRLVLLGSPGLWNAVEPDEAVACIGDSLTEESDGSVGKNPATELLRLARNRSGRHGRADRSDGLATVVIELPSSEDFECEFDDCEAEERDEDENSGKFPENSF